MPDASVTAPDPARTGEPRAHVNRDVVLAVSGLRKFYGSNEVVRGLSFEIRRGECFGLLGPNGAGKTTTLRCCLGLIDPDSGTIDRLHDLSHARSKIPETAFMSPERRSPRDPV